MFPGVENIKNPHHFRSRVFLEELPQGTSQNIWALPEELAQGKSQNIGQKTQLLTQSSDFEKNIIFIFPRVEKFDNPLHFRIRLSLRKWKSLKIHFIFGSRLSLSSSPKAYLKMIKSLDFENKLIFMFPGVENIKSPHHFRSRVFLEELPQGISQNIWALPEELAQGKSQNIGVEKFDNPLHFRIRLSLRRWKMLKIHIIFGSELSLRS
ncbi:hypothetical protein E2320_022439 [Naja naja]|nr:hypothetical protein E2320_022439 [Naja naja]